MGRPMKFEPDEAVDKAVDLFWRQGYSGTTPVELVNELGIGKGSLYRSFESKRHLFGLALRRYATERLDSLAEGLAGDGPMRPRVRAAVERLSGAGAHERGCFLVNAIAELGQVDESVAATAGDVFDGIETAFRDAIERGRDSGEFRSDRPAGETASSLLATVVGLSVLAKTRSDPARLARIVDSAVNGL
ncbi:TetR/AcrR family transcriptional regulator [Actinoplanes sp. TBRC 11911]|uniref:TetR/AcrR family transcriptional regulator n=1 Tax=Actinoplanes sp. TBRC 11911 TaxID=2729386 RepID=UPI00145CBA0D|nr:TetR/AcrR family transcriptional regulator [Actinoplanes sp. TBRC 11911]NMO50065.1 TetR/AcrR family transcriptional regulator [Actinoplanes sp. TBRC 11911]